jgi:membrane protein insertase Oxa1/YidC/SpoIIIJ
MVDPCEPFGSLNAISSPLQSGFFPLNDIPFDYTYLAFQGMDCLNSLVGFNMGLFGVSAMPAILICAISLKIATIPITLGMQNSARKTNIINIASNSILDRIRKLQNDGNMKAAMAEQSKMKSIYRANGVYGSLGLLGLAQIPIYVGLVSIIYYYLSNPIICQGVGSFLWIKDLALPDPLGIFPVITSLISSANFLLAPSSKSEYMRGMRKFAPLIPLVMLPVWMSVPSAFNIYWCINSLSHCALMLYSNSKNNKQRIKESMVIEGELETDTNK